MTWERYQGSKRELCTQWLNEYDRQCRRVALFVWHIDMKACGDHYCCVSCLERSIELGEIEFYGLLEDEEDEWIHERLQRISDEVAYYESLLRGNKLGMNSREIGQLFEGQLSSQRA